MVTLLNQDTMAFEPIEISPPMFTRLNPETFANAKEVAPGWNVYHLEQEWRAWMMDGGLDAPANPDRAFLGFCRKFFEKRGRP